MPCIAQLSVRSEDPLPPVFFFPRVFLSALQLGLTAPEIQRFTYQAAAGG